MLCALTVVLTVLTALGSGTPGWTSLTSDSTHPILTMGTAAHPPARVQASIAYDAADGYVLLFGGGGQTEALNDTWTYHAGVWKELFPKVAPPALRAAAMTYDATDGYVVLFGGSYGTSNAGESETWMFKAGVWTEMFPSTTPPARAGASMVYDNATKSVIMFSGTSNWCCSNAGIHDMWSFKHGRWTQLPLSTNPSQRNEYGFSYDPFSGQAVMFGGWIPGGAAGTLTSQTWLYKGGKWVSHATPPALSPRQGPAQSFDPLLNETIVFGGTFNNNQFTAQTWRFNASGWHEVAVSTAPEKSAYAAMTYDASDGYILLFGGGGSSGLFSYTWIFNGTGWHQLSFSGSPRAGTNAAMKYAASDGDILFALRGLGLE